MVNATKYRSTEIKNNFIVIKAAMYEKGIKDE